MGHAQFDAFVFRLKFLCYIKTGPKRKKSQNPWDFVLKLYIFRVSVCVHALSFLSIERVRVQNKFKVAKRNGMQSPNPLITSKNKLVLKYSAARNQEFPGSVFSCTGSFVYSPLNPNPRRGK